MSKTPAIFICHPRRTAIGSLAGSLANTPAPQLAATVIKSILAETKLDPTSVDQVILGSVLTAGQGQAPARQAMIYAGLPHTTQAMTINKVCSSGLKAVMLAADQIVAGHASCLIAGGMENMSLAPYYLPALRSGARLGNSEAQDSIIKDGLWDVYNNYHMGDAAELCAREQKITRAEQDEFTIESYRRAQTAVAAGTFKNEIVAVKVRRGKDEVSFESDEEPGKANLERIPTLKPVFQKDGSVTAANASSINDGAAAMIVCTEDFATRHKLTPAARIVSQGWFGQAPEWFTTAPVGAVELALKKAALDVSQIDLLELNEAFAVVALACSRQLKLDPRKVNINGGAVALGHPIGASGARILTTLIHALQREKGRFGVASLCNGGGEATALVVERV